MKLIDVLNAFFGILTIISFFALLIMGIIFHNNDLALIFGTLSFLSLSITILIVQIRKRSFPLFSIIAIIGFMIFGLVCLYFTIDSLKTKTIYTVNLEENNGVFLGSFNVPNNVKVNDKNLTFFIEATYSVSHGSSIIAEKSLLINLTGPSINKDFQIRLSGERPDTGAISSTTTIIKSDYNFIPQEGSYNFEVSPIEGDDELSLTNIRILIREYN